MPLLDAMASSRVRATAVTTSSGVAPGSLPSTFTVAGSALGKRSTANPLYENTPSVTRNAISITVKTGYFTQVSASFIDSSVHLCKMDVLTFHAGVTSQPVLSLQAVLERWSPRANHRKWPRPPCRPASAPRRPQNGAHVRLRSGPRGESDAPKRDCRSAEKPCKRRSDNSQLVREEKWFSLLSRWEWTLAERNRVSAFHRDWLGAPRPRRCANPALPPD